MSDAPSCFSIFAQRPVNSHEVTISLRHWLSCFFLGLCALLASCRTAETEPQSSHACVILRLVITDAAQGVYTIEMENTCSHAVTVSDYFKLDRSAAINPAGLTVLVIDPTGYAPIQRYTQGLEPEGWFPDLLVSAPRSYSPITIQAHGKISKSYNFQPFLQVLIGVNETESGRANPSESFDEIYRRVIASYTLQIHYFSENKGYLSVEFPREPFVIGAPVQ